MDFRGCLGRGTAWSPVARKWAVEMEDPQISSLTVGILLGVVGSASLLPEPVVRIVAKDHPSLLSQMRIIFFLILSNESLFFDGLVIALMLSGLFILVLVSGVGAMDVGLSSLAVAPVLTVVRIITVSLNKKP